MQLITTPDIQALTSAVYQRLASDTEGSSVRSALGSGASSVIHAAGLNANSLPARPFVALRRSSFVPFNMSEWRAYFNWYIYDDPAQGYYRIDTLIRLIGQAYAARDLTSPTDGATTWIVLTAGNQGEDASLNSLFFTPVQLVISV